MPMPGLEHDTEVRVASVPTQSVSTNLHFIDYYSTMKMRSRQPCARTSCAETDHSSDQDPYDSFFFFGQHKKELTN